MDALQQLTFDAKTEFVAAVLGNREGQTELFCLGESPSTNDALAPLNARGFVFAGVIAFRCGRVMVEPEPNAGLDALRILARGAGEFCDRLAKELKPQVIARTCWSGCTRYRTCATSFRPSRSIGPAPGGASLRPNFW
jgi:hypothetical protein